MSRVAAAATRDPVPSGGRRKHGPAPWRAIRNGLPITVAYLVPGSPDVPPPGMPVRRYAGTGHDSIPLPEFTGRGRCDCGQKWCPAKPNQARHTRKDTTDNA